MGELVRRRYEPGDAAVLAELVNAIEVAAGGEPTARPDELRGLIAALVRDTEADSRMVFDPGGELVGAAFTTTPPVGGFRVYLTGGVRPGWHGLGLGRELLGWQLGRAREIHAGTAPGAEWEAQVVRSPAGAGAAQRLYRRFGLAPVRFWSEMVAPAGADAAVVPVGLRVVGYDAALDEALYAAHAEAFGENWGFQRRDLASWRSLMVGAEHFAPGLSVVVLDGVEVAGYAFAYRHSEPGRAYVGQVGVRKPWRRRGLAATMLTVVRRAAADAGRTSVWLTVDADSPTGAVSVYERAGFEARYRAVTYATTLGPATGRA